MGCVVDGVPASLPFDASDVQPLLDRRRPGQSSITTKRSESDKVEILSGVEGGLTLGTPIAMIVRNEDVKKIDYEATKQVPRPGHADLSYQMKYGIRSSSGGGRSSARETIGRVCASAIAIKFLRAKYNVGFVAFVDSVMDARIPDLVHSFLIESPPKPSSIDEMSTLLVLDDHYEDVNGGCYSLADGSPLDSTGSGLNSSVAEKMVTRCPHAPTAARMAALIAATKAEKDSCGGTITCVISNCPAGLGEPVFDKFHAELAKAMMSIPAVKAFEIGSGFEGSRSMRGSEHNDRVISPSEGLFSSNNAGGVLGGVTTGQNVYFRVALKPVSSIGKTQQTAGFDGSMQDLTLKGRHDPCVLPRAVQIIESMAALTVMDFVLRQQARFGEISGFKDEI